MDTVYQKGKSLAENKLKQHRQQVKAKENANTPSTPQADFSEVQNTPKQAVHTPKTKESIQAEHKTAEVKNGIKQKPTEIAPKTRENTAFSSAPTPKTKEQAIKDARKKYVSEKLKTKAEAEKAARQNHTSDIPIHNEGLPKTNAELIKSDISALNVNSENILDTSLPSKSMPKTKYSYRYPKCIDRDKKGS